MLFSIIQNAGLQRRRKEFRGNHDLFFCKKCQSDLKKWFYTAISACPCPRSHPRGAGEKSCEDSQPQSDKEIASTPGFF